MDMSFFAEMAWKSALISGAALMLAFVLRSRSAADRALVLRIGVAMLLLMPPIAMLLPSLQIEAWAAPEAPRPADYLAASEMALAGYSAGSLTAVEPTIWDDPTPLILLAYLGGLVMAGSRLFAGLWMLGRWTRAAKPVTCPLWLAAFERTRRISRHSDRVRLMVSDQVPSPLSWGWLRPVILIDPDALADPEEADAILAHEMAHVARTDWLVLILTRAAATLFWFNPLVWLLEREIVQQAEEAADCEAAKRVEPARYAQTLLTWAQIEARAIPAHSIAPKDSALGRRVRAILDRRIRERQSGSPWTALAMLLCIAIAGPVAAMELVAATRAAPQAPVAPSAPGAPAAPAALAAQALPAAPSAPAAPEAAFAPEAPLPPGAIHINIPDIGPVIDAALAQTLPQIPTIVASAMAAAHPHPAEWAGLSPEERRELLEDRREALREAAQARVEALREAGHARSEALREAARARAEARVDIAEAQRAGREARSRVRVSMRHGAEGRLRGADGMERGAVRMEQEAERLRSDRAYRERQIARARERGETVTHEDLIEAAEGMREGAQGMREGAQGMREAARDMADDNSH